MKFECPPPACRLDHAICAGYITSYLKKESSAQETVSSEENGGGKEAGDCAKSGLQEERTCGETATNLDTKSESKDTTSHPCVENTASSDDISVGTEEKESLSKCDINSHENDHKVTSTDCKDESVKVDNDLSGATAATNLTSTEGSKDDQPSTKDAPHQNQNVNSETSVEALTSLLSIEGTRQILSSRSDDKGESDGECIRCLVCVIHGGMDTGGEIFDDCLVWRIDTPLWKSCFFLKWKP